MKRLLLILTAIFLLTNISLVAPAAVVPADSITHPLYPTYKDIAHMKLKDFQRLAGRKLTFKEKISFLILKHKLKHSKNNKTADGEVSFIFGMLGVGLLAAGFAVPATLIGALIFSILAVVFGTSAYKKDNTNRMAFMGKLLGWITLGALALLAILVVIFLANYNS